MGERRFAYIQLVLCSAAESAALPTYESQADNNNLMMSQMPDELALEYERNAMSAKLGPKGRRSGWTMLNACFHLIPVILYVSYAYTLLCVGIYALADNYTVSDHACGKAYHLWKYCCINVILWFFSCVSFCFWRGGGEITRARALLLTVLYFAMFMWGLLLWYQMSPACSNIFEKQFHAIFAFHHVCTVTNGIVFFLFFLHETILGQKFGVDFTIMAEVNWSTKPQYDWRTHGDPSSPPPLLFPRGEPEPTVVPPHVDGHNPMKVGRPPGVQAHVSQPQPSHVLPGYAQPGYAVQPTQPPVVSTKHISYNGLPQSVP